MVKLCVCKLCTCGRHRCPHNPTAQPRSDVECTFSEYVNQYKPHPLEPPTNYKPPTKAYSSSQPLDDATTHKVDYIPHPLAEKEVRRQDNQYTKPEGEMDLITNYLKEYTEKPVEYSKPIKRQEARIVAGKFEGEPTYLADYKEWTPQKRDLIKENTPYQPPDLPFDASTNYQSEFIPKKGEAARTLKPVVQISDNKTPFEGDSNYTMDYVPHALPTKEIREKVAWQPNDVPFDELTNYMMEYTAKEGIQKIPLIKPDVKPYVSSAPFEGDTTQKVDYIPWQIEKKEIKKEKEIYHSPDGEMDLLTTHNNDYVPKPLEQKKILKKMEYKKPVGNFDGTTNYKSEYLEWSAPQTQILKPKELYQPPDTLFDGSATYKVDYVEHKPVFTRSLKPSYQLNLEKGPMENGTEYKKEFYKKDVEICPAALAKLMSDPRYKFSDKDEDGHEWYEVTRSASRKK